MTDHKFPDKSITFVPRADEGKRTVSEIVSMAWY